MRPLACAFALLLVAAASLGAEGCSSGTGGGHPPCEGVAPDRQESCLSDHYFSGATAFTNPPCSGFRASAQKIGGRKEILFFQGAGVGDEDLVTEGRFLARFYAPYELTFFTVSPAQGASLEFALSGTDAELDAVLRKAGVPAGSKPTAEQQKAIDRLVADVVFGPLREFVKSESSPPKGRVDVVVLAHIASPDIAKQFNGGVIGGLGISPPLFKSIAASDPSKNLFDLLALPPEFTPTLFLGHTDIVNLAKNPDGIVAHEMGHAMGLQHTQESGNLMTQYQTAQPCVPGLTDAQVAQLKGAAHELTALDALDAPGAVQSWQTLLDLHHALVERAVARNGGRRP